MNITDILAHDDSDNGTNISSIDKSMVSSIKEATDAGQVVFVQDNKGNKLKLLIKCKNLQLTENQIGTYITVRASNDGKKLEGVKFSCVNGKKKVVVSSKANVIYSESPESKTDKKTIPKQEEPKTQLTEKEPEYNLPEEFMPGPQDDHILELFRERAYIYNLIKHNNPDNIQINFDAPWITGIHIDCSNNRKGILAPEPKKKK